MSLTEQIQMIQDGLFDNKFPPGDLQQVLSNGTQRAVNWRRIRPAVEALRQMSWYQADSQWDFFLDPERYPVGRPMDLRPDEVGTFQDLVQTLVSETTEGIRILSSVHPKISLTDVTVTILEQGISDVLLAPSQISHIPNSHSTQMSRFHHRPSTGLFLGLASAVGSPAQLLPGGLGGRADVQVAVLGAQGLVGGRDPVGRAQGAGDFAIGEVNRGLPHGIGHTRLHERGVHLLPLTGLELPSFRCSAIQREQIELRTDPPTWRPAATNDSLVALPCQTRAACRHRTRVTRTAKSGTSGALARAASMTFASTHPIALAVHSGSVTDTPRPERAGETTVHGISTGPLTECCSGTAATGPNSNDPVFHRWR